MTYKILFLFMAEAPTKKKAKAMKKKYADKRMSIFIQGVK